MDNDTNNLETPINQKCKILIIGAGMAGLSAANHLIKNGIRDFKIVEARKRIGGRIIGLNIGSQRVELGANWIHGVLGNPMFELAMANGLIDIINVPKPHKVIAATEEGKQVPFSILQEIYEAYVCFLRRCEEYFLCQYLPPPDIHSVGEHIGLETEIYLKQITDPQERKLRQLIFDCLLKRETCISGCHAMEEIDLLELGSYTELQGGNIVLPAGYSAILEPVSRHIPPENIIRQSPVTNINWMHSSGQSITSPSDSGIDDAGNDSDDSDRTVTGDTPKQSANNSRQPSCERGNSASGNTSTNVKVVCENGTIYYTDHVICTIPLGVLKEKSNTLFTPELPQYKLEAIDRLLYGTVDKIFLDYDRPFLNPNISEVMLLWEPDDQKDDLANSWYKKIYSFSKVSETLLLGWISGKEAEYMETLDSEIVSEECTRILRKFLNDPFVPKPKQCICTSWHKQPYSRGSYTAMAVGACQIDIENIAQPIYSHPQQSKPVVLFAGEHTHSNFYSTVHGAYLSGRTAAQVLVTPESPQEIVMECVDTSDLSSWIQGISLD